MSAYFIAGTDTGVGKTLIATALISHLVATGQRIAAMKPIAAGCVQTEEGWLNDDVTHIAPQQAGVETDLARIEQAFRAIAAQADSVIVEGVGGFWCP